MKEPYNLSQLLKAVTLIGKHCEETPCRDCPFCCMGICVLGNYAPEDWLGYLPDDERSEEE